MNEECRGCYLFATCPARTSAPDRYRELVAGGSTPWEAVEQVAREKMMTATEVYAAVERAAGKL